MSNVEIAVSRFQEGCSCSQAILSTYGEQFGLDRETALKIAAGFGGGMGRMGGTCGAVTGALMVLGLRYGGTGPQDSEAKETTYQRVRECAARFTARNGSIACKDLLGCDISSPEGLAAARERQLFSTICPKFVRDAGEILEAML